MSFLERVKDKLSKNRVPPLVLAGLLGLLVIRRLAQTISLSQKRSTYQTGVIALIKARDEKLRQFVASYDKEVPQELQRQILNSSLQDLAHGIRDRKFSSRQIVITYSLRAAIIGKDYSLIAQPNFDHAIDLATKKDEERNNLIELPLLYGLPFSVKEQLRVKGTVVTAGYSRAAAFKPSAEDAAIVELLKNHGAIPFVTSNVPQGLFGVISSNAVYGFSKNPWNQYRSVGGSSGGEAGLVSARCSPFGIGSDAAGSLRIPSSFCGVYCFKPTGRRISKKGRIGVTLSDVDTFREAEASLGPIARNVEDLVLVSRAILEKYEKDPTTVYIPFKEHSYKRGQGEKLNIAYMEESTQCEVAPAIRNVIVETVAALKNLGHNVFPLAFPEIDQLNAAMFELFMGLGSFPLKFGLEGEEPATFNQWRVKLDSLSKPVLGLLCQYYVLKGQKRLSEWAWRYRAKSLKEFFGSARVKEMIKNKFTQIWSEKQIDALIIPAWPTTAMVEKDSDKVLPYLTFEVLANAFDLPAGVVPIRKVKAEEEVFVSKFGDEISEAIQENVKNSRGLPIGLQVVTMSFEDELCLGVMKQIEKIFDFHELPVVGEIPV